MLVQQPRGYGGYHGTEGGQEPDGGQEREEGPAEASPRHVKENHIPRELRRLHEHFLGLSDSEAKSNHPRRTRASSVPDPTSAIAPARAQLATQSADQGVKKRYADPIWQVFLCLQYLCVLRSLRGSCQLELACEATDRVSGCKPCIFVQQLMSMLLPMPMSTNFAAIDWQQIGA